MAGDWIKMRSNLWDDPRVARICDETDQSEAAVVGALYWLWAAADQHTETGVMVGLSLRQIDRKTGVQGFGAALQTIGWIEETPDGVRIVNFEEHNGESAKRRCSDAKRKASARNASAECPQIDGQIPEDFGQPAELEKEKEKEILTTSSVSAETARCPVEKIIETYRQHAPSLIQPRIVADATKSQIAARWRQDPRHQHLAFWERFFGKCELSDFLSGRTDGRGAKPFRVGLDWVVKASNFAKIINGNYDNRDTE